MFADEWIFFAEEIKPGATTPPVSAIHRNTASPVAPGLPSTRQYPAGIRRPTLPGRTMEPRVAPLLGPAIEPRVAPLPQAPTIQRIGIRRRTPASCDRRRHLARSREMRVGKAGLRILEIDAIALVDGGWRNSAAGHRGRNGDGRGTRSRDRSGGWNGWRFEELIGQLLNELLIAQQSREIAITRKPRDIAITRKPRDSEIIRQPR